MEDNKTDSIKTKTANNERRGNREKEQAGEKPSDKKNAGTKKHQKELRDKILRGEMIPAEKVGQKHLKGKRQINKYKAQKRLTSLRDFHRK